MLPGVNAPARNADPEPVAQRDEKDGNERAGFALGPDNEVGATINAVPGTSPAALRHLSPLPAQAVAGVQERLPDRVQVNGRCSSPCGRQRNRHSKTTTRI